MRQEQTNEDLIIIFMLISIYTHTCIYLYLLQVGIFLFV